jgi:hypothetical protein
VIPACPEENLVRDAIAGAGGNIGRPSRLGGVENSVSDISITGFVFVEPRRSGGPESGLALADHPLSLIGQLFQTRSPAAASVGPKQSEALSTQQT